MKQIYDAPTKQAATDTISAVTVVEINDPTAVGEAIEVIEELATIPGVAGVHIMAPGNDAAVPDIIKAARDSITRLAPA